MKNPKMEHRIENLSSSHTPGAGIAYLAALGAVFVGGLYSFRLVFFTFHGKERFTEPHHDDHAHRDDSEHHGQQRDARRHIGIMQPFKHAHTCTHVHIHKTGI